MQSKAATVDEYLKELPEDRREAIATLRQLVNEHLPEGYEESMGFGMICWGIPLARYPSTYNKQPLGIVALASQKQYMSLYLFGTYSVPEVEAWFNEAWRKSGKKLDMGKSCLRFKKLDDLALDVVAEVVGKVTPEALIARYEEVRAALPAKPKRSGSRST